MALLKVLLFAHVLAVALAFVPAPRAPTKVALRAAEAAPGHERFEYDLVAMLANECLSGEGCSVETMGDLHNELMRTVIRQERELKDAKALLKDLAATMKGSDPKEVNSIAAAIKAAFDMKGSHDPKATKYIPVGAPSIDYHEGQKLRTPWQLRLDDSLWRSWKKSKKFKKKFNS
jgi:hypothetical protein